jgi:hypothetical protein
MLAADILKKVNDGGHSSQELAQAKGSLEEAIAALRHAPKPSLSEALMKFAAKNGFSMAEVVEAIRTVGVEPRPVAAC